MALKSTYTYSVLKSTWGVLVAITAETRSYEGDGTNAVSLGSGIWLVDATPGRGLSVDIIEMLSRGLQPLLGEIFQTENGAPRAIAIREIRYNDCDFQLEGIAAAIFGWAIADFGLTPREIPVSFHREENRYIFHLPTGGAT